MFTNTYSGNSIMSIIIKIQDFRLLLELVSVYKKYIIIY